MEKFMTETVLVTGGAGYIGSHLVHRLVEDGYRVVVLDNFSQGHRDALRPEAEIAEVDLADHDRVFSVFARHRFDAVFHLASNALVGESMRLPFHYLRNNVFNGINLIQTAVAHDVPKFVFSSTCNMFADDGGGAMDETTAISPGSPYGESKFIIERVLDWADRVCGMRSACLRYFNAAGCHPNGRLGERHDPETHLIPIVLQAALGLRSHVDVFGGDYPTPDGTCIRDYVHVCDIADVHVRVLSLLDERSCQFNIGTGHGCSVLEVIDTARRITGRDIALRIHDRRPGDPPFRIASPERLRRDLGWTPGFPKLDDIIATAWNWHRRQTGDQTIRQTGQPVLAGTAVATAGAAQARRKVS
jgi:UDP-glucose 4-epimerase